MSLCKCLLSASLVSLALPAAHGEAHCPGNVASLPLRVVQSSLIVVPIEINHSGPYDFVVDTGAQVSTIEPALASELRLKVEGTTGVGGVATYGRNAYAYLDLIAAGDHSVSNTIVVLQELDQLKAADSRIRGILGANFLEHFDMLIDNRQHILCLDSSGMLARAVKGEHFALAEPRGSQTDLPFTRPIVVAVRLSDLGRTSVILRLDSGSNVPLLYAADQGLRKSSANSSPLLKRVVNGVEQVFALLPPQNIEIGKGSVRQVSFVMPLNPIGGGPVPREDGLLPTMVFQRVFVSPVGRYATLDPW
jgi:hypothetical protein